MTKTAPKTPKLTTTIDGTFTIGDGATYRLHTDCAAYTVVGIERGGRTVVLQADTATLLNAPASGEPDALTAIPGGFSVIVSGTQRWAYEPNPGGAIIRASLRAVKRNGVVVREVWKLAGHGTMSPGCSVTPGRRAHYDYNY